MSTLKTGALRGTSGTADSIQLHASNQSVTFPGNVTCSGTATGFGTANLKIETAGYNCEDDGSQHDDQNLVFTVGDGCISFTITMNMLSCGGTDKILLDLGYGGSPTYTTSFLGNSTFINHGDGDLIAYDLDGSEGILNNNWTAAHHVWIGTIQGHKCQSPTSGAHIWQMTWSATSRNYPGWVWSGYRVNLGTGNGRLTALRLKSESATGFDAGTVGYQGILQV